MNSIPERVPGTRLNELQKRRRTCAVSGAAANHDVLPLRCILVPRRRGTRENATTNGRRTTTIVDDMPDTKRTRTRFLNYVNAFNNGLLRDQTAITSPPPGFHWSLVENAARRVPFENRSDGGLAAVVTDPPALSRNRFSSSRNRFYETKRRSLASSHDWLIFVTMFYRGTALRLKLREGQNRVRKASFLLFFYVRD